MQQLVSDELAIQRNTQRIRKVRGLAVLLQVALTSPAAAVRP